MKKKYIQSAMCIVRMQRNIICTSPGGQKSLNLYTEDDAQITSTAEVW